MRPREPEKREERLSIRHVVEYSPYLVHLAIAARAISVPGPFRTPKNGLIFSIRCPSFGLVLVALLLLVDIRNMSASRQTEYIACACWW